MTVIRSTFLTLFALLAILPAKPARADLPTTVTPTAGMARPEVAAKPAGPCRPGVAGVTLNSGQAIWTLSPCSGALESVHLTDPQFRVTARHEPAGLPGWAKAKYADGQLDLVPTWDAPWDPFQDNLIQALVAGQPSVKIQRRAGASTMTQTVPSLAALQKAEPQWAVLSHDAAHVAMIWPDPQKVQSPIYLVKTWKPAGKTAAGSEQPL